MKYARETEVPVARSKAEIETLLQRYGAGQFVSGWEKHRAVIGFEAHGRHVRFDLPLPRAEEYAVTRGGVRRTKLQVERAHEQGCKQRWRALALVVKAKLEAVESGIATFEEEFLAHVVLPGSGQTVGEWLRPQLSAAYEAGKMPALLPGGYGRKLKEVGG